MSAFEPIRQKRNRNTLDVLSSAQSVWSGGPYERFLLRDALQVLSHVACAQPVNDLDSDVSADPGRWELLMGQGLELLPYSSSRL